MPAFNPFTFFARQARPILGHPLRNLVSTAKYLAVAHLFWEYGYSVGPAQGPSMLPTFEISDEWLLISKRHRHGRDVTVGDLVVYKIPIFPDSDGIKRVLGLPGDYVMLDTPESGSEAMIQVCFSPTPPPLRLGGGSHEKPCLLTSYRFPKDTVGWLATIYLPLEIRGSLGRFRWP
jgi:signal peptidase I